ncbi:MAG: hypothetical protein PHD43_12860 [Methylococcales bacterium]|nr:hypothetical protein [Methylococcales bacterium]
MKTRITTHIIAVVSALTMGVLNATGIKAETAAGTSALIYNNRAYVQDIGYAPNPAPAWKVQDAEIIYVDTAYGPAIYSYPTNVSHHHTAFNVEYVDTAYGPAIYSYPRNKGKHHLKLVDNAVNPGNGFIVPASLRMSRVPASTPENIR